MLVAAILAGGLVVHGLLPRYEAIVEDNGALVIVFDRWTGSFQRATYDANGEPRASGVVRPF